VVTHQLQVERRTAKARRPKTDVLPLDHATNQLMLCEQNVPKLCQVVVSCVAAFAVDFWLQTNLFQSGVLWHLLLFLFDYDFTLEEGGVEKSDESNQQVVYC